MSLSSLDTEENRTLLQDFLNLSGYGNKILHGYNHVKNVALADYDNLKLTSDGYAYKIQIRIEDYIPMSEEFVVVFLPTAKQFNSDIGQLTKDFFSSQLTIDSKRKDEFYVLSQVKKLNSEYQSLLTITKSVECFVKSKKISRNKGKTTIEGFIKSKEDWLNVEAIAGFTSERQVAIMPFNDYMAFLEINDIDQFNQIQDERDKKNQPDQE